MQRLLLDTNAVIYFFDGEESISELVLDQENEVIISFITKIELLCFETDDMDIMKNISEFLEEIKVIFIDDDIIFKAIEYRKKHKLKVPDAIIAATTKAHELTLVTADKSLSKKIEDIDITSPI